MVFIERFLNLKKEYSLFFYRCLDAIEEYKVIYTMKLKYVILSVMLFAIVFAAGCKTEVLPVEDDVIIEKEETDSSDPGGETDEESTDDTSETDTDEETTDDEATEDSSEADENVTATSNETKEIVIKGFDSADLTIKAGDTVKWTNSMENYKHIIIILPSKEDGEGFKSVWINDAFEGTILPGESYEYTFNETGDFKWGSKVKFQNIYGIITVE